MSLAVRSVLPQLPPSNLFNCFALDNFTDSTWLYSQLILCDLIEALLEFRYLLKYAHKIFETHVILSVFMHCMVCPQGALCELSSL